MKVTQTYLIVYGNVLSTADILRLVITVYVSRLNQ